MVSSGPSYCTSTRTLVAWNHKFGRRERFAVLRRSDDDLFAFETRVEFCNGECDRVTVIAFCEDDMLQMRFAAGQIDPARRLQHRPKQSASVGRTRRIGLARGWNLDGGGRQGGEVGGRVAARMGDAAG
jgi:hypothetical protein